MRKPRSFVRPVANQPLAGRRIQVYAEDTLLIGGFEVQAEILTAVLDPKVRALWAFVHDEEGRCQPTPVTEEQCIWLQNSDMQRGPKDEPQWIGSVQRARRYKRTSAK
jgi:hypothetical protein